MQSAQVLSTEALRILQATVPALGNLPHELQDVALRRLRQLHVAAGRKVVREGELERGAFIILEGEARVRRQGVEIGRLRTGDHFGELELFIPQPRAASVVASTDLWLIALTLEDYEALQEESPRLALQLVETFFLGIGQRLMSVTDSYGQMLSQRTLPRKTQLRVTIAGESRIVRTGVRLSELLPPRIDGELVVAGLVDRKPVSLGAALSSDCEVEALTTASLDGQRIYRNSQALLLLEAAEALRPGLVVQVGHSLGFAQRINVRNMRSDEFPAFAAELAARMHELAAKRRELREEWWTVEEAKEHFRQQGWNAAATLLESWRDPAVPLQSYGAVYALSNGPLVDDSSKLDGFQVLAEEEGILLLHGKRGSSAAERGEERASYRPSVIVQEALAVSKQAAVLTTSQDRWLEAVGIRSVGAFNRACTRGHVSELVFVSEGFQEKRISQIADEIDRRRGSVRVVTIAGPSSSGKTTFIKRLRVQLQVNGLNPVPISLDNYYVDRKDNPRDEHGNYDYEALEALRIELLQSHIRALLEGTPTTTARYDFDKGASDPAGGPHLQLGPDDILMLEGIHGLNPKLLASIPDERIFRVFVCPLAQLPFDRAGRVYASDVRLIRRIVRDRHSRGTNAADNIARWPSVREGERKHIFPYQHHADAVFDTSLIYELAVLKVFAERDLLEVSQAHPSYTTAYRLLQLLDRFVPIYPDMVPPTSLLREFIGGSAFHY